MICAPDKSCKTFVQGMSFLSSQFLVNSSAVSGEFAVELLLFLQKHDIRIAIYAGCFCARRLHIFCRSDGVDAFFVHV